MFHTECVGSVYQVSIFWSGATFPLVGTGGGGRQDTGVHRGSWTTLTLSVNPIIVTGLQAGCYGNAPARLPAGIYRCQKWCDAITKAVSQCKWKDMLSSCQSKWQWHIVWHLHSLKILRLAVRHSNRNCCMSEFSECEKLLHKVNVKFQTGTVSLSQWQNMDIFKPILCNSQYIFILKAITLYRT